MFDSHFSAIYNFNTTDNLKLNLTVGDAVRILEEEENWYYGYVISNWDVKGVFPKSYIHRKKCERFEGGVPIFKHPVICQEITSVLREWSGHVKHLYVVCRLSLDSSLFL